MGLASSVAIAAAQRVERTGGLRAGLAAWRLLAESAIDAETRGTALLAALRCAIEVRDVVALDALVLAWGSVTTGIHDEVFDHVRAAWRAGLGSRATALARAEATRLRSARALHAHARCLEASGDPARAEPVYGEAAQRADKEGLAELATLARVRRARILAADPRRAREGLEEARRASDAPAARRLPPRPRLVLARILLRAPSRFVRAGAIDLLDPVVSGDDATLADRALAVLAAHADDAGDELSPMESDRLLALFARPAVAARAARARQALAIVASFARARAARDEERDLGLRAALDAAAGLDAGLGALHARARDLVTGRFEAHAAATIHAAARATAEPAAHASHEASWRGAWASVLDLAFALRDRAHGRAVLVLAALAALATRHGRRDDQGPAVPVHVWTPLAAALASDEVEVRGAALTLAEALLASPSRKAPPRGWLPLAATLVVAGREDLAELARRAAARHGEPGATDALALALSRAAWQAARVGDRAGALSLLREARALGATR